MSEPESSYFQRKSKINRFFSWQSLRKFGSSKAVKSSYYWIFLIPLIAKIAHQLYPFALNLLGIQQAAKFSLPFSWYLLYFSALSFALASFLYDIFCPRIISYFKNFREFIDFGYENLFIIDELKKNISNDVLHNSQLYPAFFLALQKFKHSSEALKDNNYILQVCCGIQKMDRENLGGIFYAFTEVVNHSHPKIMKLTSCFYYLGFSLLFVVLLQNINSVLIEMFGVKFAMYFKF